jgi:hypothetical protein
VVCVVCVSVRPFVMISGETLRGAPLKAGGVRESVCPRPTLPTSSLALVFPSPLLTTNNILASSPKTDSGPI